MGSRQCGMCSHRNRVDAETCERCGVSLVGETDKITVTVDDVPSDTAPTPVVQAQPATEVAPPPYEVPAPPAGGSGPAGSTTRLLVLLLLVAGAVIAVLVGILLLQGDDDVAPAVTQAPVATAAPTTGAPFTPPPETPVVTAEPALAIAFYFQTRGTEAEQQFSSQAAREAFDSIGVTELLEIGDCGQDGERSFDCFITTNAGDLIVELAQESPGGGLEVVDVGRPG